MNYRELAWYIITSYYVLQIIYRKAKLRTITTVLTTTHISVRALKLVSFMPSSLPQYERAFTCTPTAWMSWSPNSRDVWYLKTSAAILSTARFETEIRCSSLILFIGLYDSLDEQRLFC